MIMGLHAGHVLPLYLTQGGFLDVTAHYAAVDMVSPNFCCVADDQEDEEVFLEAMTNPAVASTHHQMGIQVKSSSQADWSPVLPLQAGKQQAGRLCFCTTKKCAEVTSCELLLLSKPPLIMLLYP